MYVHALSKIELDVRFQQNNDRRSLAHKSQNNNMIPNIRNILVFFF